VSAWASLVGEQRRFARVVPLKNAPVEIQIMGGTFLDVLYARDLSLGGVSVHVPHAFDGCNLSDEVELVVKLPKQRAFLARGVIRRFDRERTSFAVEFTRLGDKEKKVLEDYVVELIARGRTL
jgi:hypothetical protein